MKYKVQLIKNIIPALVFILAFFSFQQVKAQTGRGKVVTLQQAIQQTVNNHPLIKEAQSQVAVAHSKTEEQKSSLMPVVAANLTYNRIGPVPTIGFNGVSFPIATANNLDENVAAEYVVYDFNRRKDVIKLLQSTETTEAEKINVIKNNLAYETAQVYYSMLYIQKSMHVMDRQISDLEEHLTVAKKRVMTGSATGLDTLNTSVRLSVLQNQKMTLKNQWMKAAVVLKSLMGLSVHDKIQVTGNLEHSIQSYQVDTLVNRAFLQREEIRINNLVLHTEKLQKDLVAKTDMPVLAVHGSVGVKNGYPDNLNKIRPNYVLGLAAKVPIFDGHKKQLKVNTAQLNIQTSEDHAAVLKRNISTAVERALLEYRNNQTQLESAEQEIVMAKAALKQAKGLYNTGAITNTTLLDTETAVSQARLKYSYQQYQLTISHYRLLQATGAKIW